MAGCTPPPGTYLTDLDYQQVSGDSGAGAVIGNFEGRVTALGPVFTYSFQLGSLPVSSEWKYFHEFDTRNRVEGDDGFVNFSMPLDK
ncbi:transporter [Parvibaculum sp.]|uniref:transporter n=1 Tax=Parvibaculum sp. TaxID=2024848 RepID=UPI003BAD500E